MDQKRASAEARVAFEHWQAKRLQQAVQCYTSAVAHADPAHHATPGYHQELACVQAELGHSQEALAEFREALRLEELQSSADSASVANARYFLGEHCLRMNLLPEALATVVSPSAPRSQRPLLLLVEALARAGLGDHVAAAQQARAAVASAASDQQREAIAARVVDILGAETAAS